ncbi:MAG: hypothetical protein ACK5A1_21130, partial [Planctomyces sp.]
SKRFREETAGDGRKFRVYSQLSSIYCSIFLTAGAVKKIGANATDLEIQTETFRFRKRLCVSGGLQN